MLDEADLQMLDEAEWSGLLKALFIVVALVGCFSADTAGARQRSSHNTRGYSCADVRAFVAQVGRGPALAMALAYGINSRQLRQARACL
jgi:hypothetical protein